MSDDNPLANPVTVTILPCPFCHEMPMAFARVHGSVKDGTWGTWVYRLGCACPASPLTQWCSSPEDVRTAWNTLVGAVNLNGGT